MQQSTKRPEKPKKCPRLTANPLSVIFFSWLNSLFWYGRKHDIEEKDLYDVLPEDHSGPLGDRLERFWRKEVESAQKSKRKPRLYNAIKKTFGWAYAWYAPHCLFLSIGTRVFQPLVLGYYIGHFDNSSQTTETEAYIFATVVVLLSFLQSIVAHHATFGALQIGMRLRVACSSLIYRKSLKLSCSSVKRASSGFLINLLSNDVGRFELLFAFLHYIWVLPLQVAVITYLIWQKVGAAALAGVLLISLQTIPVQFHCGKLTSRFRSQVSKRTDDRVLLMHEIINGIRVIKMYTWEKPFEKAVSLARKYEIDVLTTKSYLLGISLASFIFTERTTLYVTIVAFVLQGNPLLAEIAFPLAQYFNILQLTMAIFYPKAITSAAEANVSLKRIEKYLLLDEYKPIEKSIANNEETGSVTIKDASASWTANTIAHTLHDVNVIIKPKKLYAVIGPVGAGKSSFLKLILGELKTSCGTVSGLGKVSYASQEPWLYNGTVRSNILFDEPYNEKKYKEITKVCTLVKDFEQLSFGDKSLVGERGTSLSGGQCARVNFARAVYKDADIYLFDDPLSAVDTHVGKHLFEDCITKFLNDKTRILVTHQVQYLKNVDWILYINNGRLEFQGTYQDFKEHNQIIQNLTTSDNRSEKSFSDDTSLDISNADDELISNLANQNDNMEEPKETAELMSRGKLAKSLIWNYWKAGGSYCLILSFFLTFMVSQIVVSGYDFWLKYWTKQEQMKLQNTTMSELLNINNRPLVDVKNTSKLDHSNETEAVKNEYIFLELNFAVQVYTLLIIGTIILPTLRNLIFYKICMNASKNLHNNMFSCLLRAPMRFFDVNPSGRILNRFSKDVGAVDESLPVAMLDALQIFSVMLGILGQVLIINWWTIFPMIIMAILYIQIKDLYLATIQDIKRLEGNAKSPVFSHTNSSLSGLLTIRASQAQKIVCKEFDILQDMHTRAYYLIIATSTTFSFWLDQVSVAFVAFITYSFIIFDRNDTFAGDVGLAITQVLILCGMLPYGMRQTAEMITQMTSVERIFQFTQLEQEGPFESEPGKNPPKDWPQLGRIEFRDLYLKYSEDAEPVLKKLNFAIDPGMRLGIVGRTGAGKSSLISAIFHLADIEGSLLIDGVDISKIGLRDLRSKISIIPQEPMLFTASLRDNIDPFEEFSDKDLSSAIKNVELDRAFVSLDHSVERSGSNLSAGQRQLICLARAIVKKNKILILDEATANVDPSTDALIQKTIRNQFASCTVLTIAHRLNTIMDSDKVLVMEHGEAVEFDHPHILLRKDNGYFANMVKQTGKQMADNLSKIAKEAYQNAVQTEQANEASENSSTDIINNQ